MTKDKSIWRVLAFFAALALSISFQFRSQILNGFSVLYGDRYDSVIAVSILEHWFNFFTGSSKWSQLFYFFPYEKTLGHTDGYFLVGIIYYPFRSLGLDPFISGELANMSLRATGFIGIFVVCRRILTIPYHWSLLAGVLFTLCNSFTSHGYRLQFNTIAFAPILMLLIWHAYQGFVNGNSRKVLSFGISASLLFGAWCITCFYLAWFFLFFSLCMGSALLVRARAAQLAIFWKRLTEQRAVIALICTSATFSMIPFIWIYFAKSREVGVRSYATVFSYTVPVEGILQVGSGNYMFGKLYNDLLSVISPNYQLVGEYSYTGIAPLMFITFVAGCIYIFRTRDLETWHVMTAMIVGVIFTWSLTLRIFEHSLWYAVYQTVPGAKALNVISAYQMFLILPIILVCTLYLSKVVTAGTPKILVLIIVAILILEETNTSYVTLIRADEINRVSLKEVPPPGCAVFFVTGEQTTKTKEDWVSNSYPHNVTAMLLSELIHMPTINGIASFTPPDWNFAFPHKSDYVERVRNYARAHNVRGLCKLDLDSLTWDASW